MATRPSISSIAKLAQEVARKEANDDSVKTSDPEVLTAIESVLGMLEQKGRNNPEIAAVVEEVKGLIQTSSNQNPH